MYPRTLNVKLTLHAGRESPAIVGISAPHSLVCGLPCSRPHAGSNLTLLSGEKGKENISYRKQPASLWRGMVEVSPMFYTIHYYVWCVTDPLPLWFSHRTAVSEVAGCCPADISRLPRHHVDGGGGGSCINSPLFMASFLGVANSHMQSAYSLQITAVKPAWWSSKTILPTDCMQQGKDWWGEHSWEHDMKKD